MNFKFNKPIFFIIETVIVPIVWFAILTKCFKLQYKNLYIFIAIMVLLCHVTLRFIKKYRDR